MLYKMEFKELSDLLLTLPNLMILCSVWSLIQALGKSLPNIFGKSVTKRLKPGAGLALCVVACMIPGVQPDDMGMTDRVMVGTILGNAVGHAHKIIGRTFLGMGIDSEPGEAVKKARKVLT